MWSNGDHGSIGHPRAGLEMNALTNIGAAPLRSYRDNGTVLPNWVSASSGVEVRILMLAAKIHLAYSLLRMEEYNCDWRMDSGGYYRSVREVETKIMLERCRLHGLNQHSTLNYHEDEDEKLSFRLKP
jgi:hypothetical protein